MAKRFEYKQSSQVRRRRIFSKEFKQQKVREIEKGTSRVSDISREYEVSMSNIYRWLEQYGINYKRQGEVLPQRTSLMS